MSFSHIKDGCKLEYVCVCVCVCELKEIISNVKYQESVLRKILSDRGYHAHYLYIFLNGYVEPNETDFILRNF
jgi:hypothetical protein